MVEVWSANRLKQFRKAGFPRAHSLREVSAERRQMIAAQGAAPEILSPQSSLTYYIQSGSDDQNRISLEAHAAPGTRQIHWFADRRYLGASTPAEPMPWQPAIGDYELQAMDDSGRVTTRQIRVRLALAE